MQKGQFAMTLNNKFLAAAVLIISALMLLPVRSEAVQFGKNKVQYRTFDWKYISTSNFDIYYDNGSKYLAEFAAVEAEKALTHITAVVKFRINKKIPILIYNTQNEFQQTNVISSYMSEGIEGVTELYKNRVVLPFLGDYSNFRHVIHHELTHAVLNQYLYGGSFQTAVQAGQNVDLPLFMNEGLAEYLSLGGQDTQNDMYIRDMALSENLKGLEYMTDYLAYRGGQTFYWYVAEKYGEDKIGELLQKIRVGYSLDKAFQAVFKMNFNDFSDMWAKDLKKYYWPEIDKFTDPHDYASSITNHKKDNTFYNTSPTISPDGSKMAYISDAGGLYAIFVREVEPTIKPGEPAEVKKPKKLISSYRRKDFEELNLITPGISWSPDGKFLAISAKAGGEDAVFIVNAENGKYKKLKFRFSAIASVAWSPDSKYLCFAACDKAFSDLYIYSFKDNKVQRLTEDAFAEDIPQWSPDSKTIYFISDRGDNLATKNNGEIWNLNYKSTNIYSIGIDSKEISKITNFTESDGKISSLSVAGDGGNLLFVSDKNGIGNVYSFNLATGITRPRTNSLTGITQLSISRDGSKLAFSSMNDGAFDIFMLKYPLDLTVPGDTLPLTRLESEKSKTVEQNNLAEEYAKQKPQNSGDSGYGQFKIKMENPKFVKRNPDASAATVKDNTNSAEAPSSMNFTEHNYKVNFTLDGIAGNPGYSTYYGFAGQAAVQFSDILGDNVILVEGNLYRDLRNSNIYLNYQYLPKLIDYDFSMFHNAAYVLRSDNYYYRFRTLGMAATAALPFDRFKRVEFSLGAYRSSMENVENSDVATETRYLIVPELHYIYDDVLYGWFAPAVGSRYNFGIKASPKLGSKTESFMILEGDYRHYFTLFHYLTFASRGSFGASIGTDKRKFYLGGTENWFNYDYANNYIPLDAPEDYIFMQFPQPLRGWDMAALSGSKYFLTNFEMRFPLFQALLAGPLPVLIQGIMGSFFFDMGGACNGSLSNFKSTTTSASGKTIPNDLLMSAGVGVRAYLLGLPFKFDIAWRNEGYTWSQPRYLFSLGYDF